MLSVVICVAVVFSEERAVVNSVVVGGGIVGHPQLPCNKKIINENHLKQIHPN